MFEYKYIQVYVASAWMHFQYLFVVIHVLLTTLFYVIDIKKQAPKEVMGQGRESPDSLYDTIDDGVESFQGNLTKTLPRSSSINR